MERLAKHECEDLGTWNEIYADNDGDWIFSADMGDAKIGIKFCPLCGLCLPPVAEELIQARKAELEEIERNRPPRKPFSMTEFNDGVKKFQVNMAVEMLKEVNSFNKLFKK